jgi:hypothetical protein
MNPIIAPGSQIVPLMRRRSEQPGYSFFRFRFRSPAWLAFGRISGLLSSISRKFQKFSGRIQPSGWCVILKPVRNPWFQSA